MDAERTDDKPVVLRKKILVKKRVQRLPHGSGATNTLNIVTPPSCYIHHLYIREQWSGNKSEPPVYKATKRDPVEITKEIGREQQKLEHANKRLIDAVLDDNVNYDVQSRTIKEEILDIQDKILKLDLERIAAQAGITPYTPPTGIRDFTIVRTVPPSIQNDIDQAERDLIPLRTKLNTAYEEWYEAHKKHEEAKKELKEFSKKKQKLAEARDKARADYELARRLQTASQEKADLGKKESRVKKTFKMDAQSKLKKADKGKTAGSEKLKEAQKKYTDFATSGYQTIKKTEKDLYEKLVEKLKEIQDITKDIVKIETEVQSAKNTLETGATIQMISFMIDDESALKEIKAKKIAPVIGVAVDGKTPRFNEQTKFCRDDPPRKNGPRKHPHIHIAEPESEIDLHFSVAKPPTGFEIYEIHRGAVSFLKKLERAYILRPVISTIKGILQYAFSFKPRKRYYRIEAETCGHSRTGEQVPDKLEATLEVFPADVYTLTIKTQSAFGIDHTLRDEKLADTTHIQGEVAYADAENAASTADHTVSSGESFSVFGVVQSSTTTSVTKSPDSIGDDGEIVPGREITTTTTLTRDGVFGSATVTDVSTGSFDGGENAYSSMMVREQGISGGDKLVSLQQSYTDKDGVVTDASKTVDSQGTATAIDGDASGSDEGATGTRPPVIPTSFFPQVPIDLALTRNGVEDPLTEPLRQTLGLIVYVVKKVADIAGRMGNFMPAVGWKYGFNATFLSGNFAYTHDFREHTDKRVWHHHKCDLDINIVTVKFFVFGGAGVEFLLFLFQIGLEVYAKGMIGVKGNFENTHPDADKNWDIGIGPTGGIGIGAEIKAIAGQPDWLMASGTIESGIAAEVMWWIQKEGEDGSFVDIDLKWQGVQLKCVAHIILVGHWEFPYAICNEREIWSGRFPREEEAERRKKKLEEVNNDLATTYKKKAKEGRKFEKKMKEKKIKLAKIKK